MCGYFAGVNVTIVALPGELDVGGVVVENVPVYLPSAFRRSDGHRLSSCVGVRSTGATNEYWVVLFLFFSLSTSRRLLVRPRLSNSKFWAIRLFRVRNATIPTFYRTRLVITVSTAVMRKQNNKEESGERRGRNTNKKSAVAANRV